MAQMTVNEIVQTGLLESLSAVNDGDKFKAGDGVFLEVKNASGGSVTVTIPVVNSSLKVPGAGTVAIADIVVAVADGATKKIFVPPVTHADANGDATVNYSGTTSVTAAVYKCPKA